MRKGREHTIAAMRSFFDFIPIKALIMTIQLRIGPEAREASNSQRKR